MCWGDLESLSAFAASLKIYAIYAIYQESFCDKNLAIRKIFGFSDSEEVPESYYYFVQICDACEESVNSKPIFIVLPVLHTISFGVIYESFDYS